MSDSQIWSCIFAN